MRGGYVGLMNCVFAAQKAVRLHLFSSVYILLSGIGMNRPRLVRLEYENHTSPDSLNSTPSNPDASQLRRLANANLVESPNRRPNPSTTLLKYPTPNIPPTSLTSHRGCVLEMEWKRGFTRVSTCTSSLLLSFSFCPLLLVHSFYSIFSSS